MAMMLLGMALFKWKVLSAEQSSVFYTKMTLFGLAAGLILSAIGVVLNFRNEWSMEFSMFLGSEFNYVGSVGTALGYVGVVMLISQSNRFKTCKIVLSSVGRMAFSSYILMTLVGTLIFYGHGLGLFGSMERTYQLIITLAIWALILIISPLWLKRFRFGPLEGLWRRLTYWSWK